MTNNYTNIITNVTSTNYTFFSPITAAVNLSFAVVAVSPVNMLYNSLPSAPLNVSKPDGYTTNVDCGNAYAAVNMTWSYPVGTTQNQVILFNVDHSDYSVIATVNDTYATSGFYYDYGGTSSWGIFAGTVNGFVRDGGSCMMYYNGN